MSSSIIDKNNTYFNRRSIRLKGYDYTKPGAYYVTICTDEHENIFGEIIDGEMVLKKLGMIADSRWEAITEHFPNVVLDEYIIMPNHVHGIFIITPVGAGLAPAPRVVSSNDSRAANNDWSKNHTNDDPMYGDVINDWPNDYEKNDNANGVNGNKTMCVNNDKASFVNYDRAMVVLNNGASFVNTDKAPCANYNRASFVLNNRATARVAPTVGNIVGAYKSIVTNECLKIFKMNNEHMGKI